MKVEKITPCICTKEKENENDSVFHGMPILIVDKNQYYSCQCPLCGRGGFFNGYRSSYLALKAWNKIQEELRTPIEFI